MNKFLKLISLAVLLTISSYQASAQPLEPYEEELFEAYFKYPEQREGITLSFYKFIEDELGRYQRVLPIPIGPFTSIFKMVYEPEHITYHIKIVQKYWDQALPTKEQVVNHLCKNDRAVLLLVVFKGRISYETYRGDSAISSDSISVTGNDCGSGI